MSFSFTSIIWILILLYTLVPAYRRRRQQQKRLQLLGNLQEQRDGSRVITMIHRQEGIQLLGIPLARYIDIEDSEAVLRAIRTTDDDRAIDLILHTPGGLVLAVEQISHALRKHPAEVTVFVPHYAMSGGTMIALAADHIVMDDNAVLGPVDPQMGQLPAPSILRAQAEKGTENIDDETLIKADVARKAVVQVTTNMKRLLEGKMAPDKADEVARALTEGRWTHDYPLMTDELQQLGIEVDTDLPPIIYELMELYPQPQRGRPSVQYLPAIAGPERDRGDI